MACRQPFHGSLLQVIFTLSKPPDCTTSSAPSTATNSSHPIRTHHFSLLQCLTLQTGSSQPLSLRDMNIQRTHRQTHQRAWKPFFYSLPSTPQTSNAGFTPLLYAISLLAGTHNPAHKPFQEAQAQIWHDPAQGSMLSPVTVPKSSSQTAPRWKEPEITNQQAHTFLLTRDIYNKKQRSGKKKRKALILQQCQPPETVQPRSPVSTIMLSTCSPFSPGPGGLFLICRAERQLLWDVTRQIWHCRDSAHLALGKS